MDDEQPAGPLNTLWNHSCRSLNFGFLWRHRARRLLPTSRRRLVLTETCTPYCADINIWFMLVTWYLWLEFGELENYIVRIFVSQMSDEHVLFWHVTVYCCTTRNYAVDRLDIQSHSGLQGSELSSVFKYTVYSEFNIYSRFVLSIRSWLASHILCRTLLVAQQFLRH